MNSASPPPKKKKKFSANSCFALAPLFELNVASQWQLKRPGYC